MMFIETCGYVRVTNFTLSHRLANREDLEVLRELMDVAIAENQKALLTPVQIESSRTIKGLDTQLIEDGTYFIVEDQGKLVGCGGWSRRATLYGGNQTPGRSADLPDPAKDAARVRAMYTYPGHTGKGIGTLILSLCEKAASREGFRRVELMATMSGELLYRARGYQPDELVSDSRGGAAVPLLKMHKDLRPGA